MNEMCSEVCDKNSSCYRDVEINTISYHMDCKTDDILKLSHDNELKEIED